MMAGRTFGAKLAAGFGLTLALTVLMTATSVLALRYVLVTKDKALKTASSTLVESQVLNVLIERRIADYRAYILSGKVEWQNATAQDRKDFLDQEARVRAVGNLRVVDASIMPKVVSANINAPLIMMAEKISDQIRGVTPLPPADATYYSGPTP